MFRYLLVVLGALSLAGALLPTAPQTTEVVYKQFHVDSLIVSRYAVTTITSVVRNNADQARELDFQVQLPETAFISKFTMIVNNKTSHGIAKEKEQAAQEYEDQQEAGQNVGLVESRGTEVFSVRTNTAANSEATFILQYEDLIIRRRSKYQQVLNLNPGAVVEDLKVEVKVVDQQGVVGEGASEFVTTEKVSDNEVLFSYSPTAEQQLEDSDHGLARDLSVEYDVVHPPTGAGQIVVDENCYFAQFFSPSGIAAVPVDLVFVIDVSGSMRGRKIEQTREALETIINQLGSSDRFTMVTFSSDVRHWRETLVSVSEYRQQAVQFARGLQADGLTDFNNGLLSGASILKTHGSSDHIPLLVILTDGQPTTGERRENSIMENAAETLAGTAISLNCLGFGFHLNYQLLEKLSLANNGIARRIYEGEDAPEQLEGFFEEISSPILRDISITYDASLELISNTQFPILFNGSEIVVAGRYNCSVNGSDTLIVTVNGTGVSQEIVFNSEVDVHQNITVGNITSNIERLAAYLIVKQLIEKLDLTDSEEEANVVRRQALTFALRYNFVTKLTSLIVTEEGAGDGEGKQLGGPAETEQPLQDSAIPMQNSPFSSPPLFAHPQPTYMLPSTAQPFAPIRPFTPPPATFGTVPASPSTLSPQPPTTCTSLSVNGSLYIYRTGNTPLMINGFVFVEFDSPANSQVNCTLRRRKKELVKVDCSNGVFYYDTTAHGDSNYTLLIEAVDQNGNMKVKETAIPVYQDPTFCYGHVINEGSMCGNTVSIPFMMYGPHTAMTCRIIGDSQGYTPCTNPYTTPTSLPPGNYTLVVKPNGCPRKRNLKIHFSIN